MKTRTVPFFEYSRLFADDKEALMEVIEDVLGRGAYIFGSDLSQFEVAIADYAGVQYCIGVANATDALRLALEAAGVGPGDEVILPSHTFVASAGAIHELGAHPVLVDVGDDHLVGAEHIEPAISRLTKAILPVSLNGRTCEMDGIINIAESHGLAVVEDSAQGLGSRFRGKMAGAAGLAGVYSFYPAKILGTFGDGGAIVTNDADVAAFCRAARDHGRDPSTGEVVGWGVNSRLDNLHAAILLHFFQTYGSTIRRRREIAEMYQSGLGDLGQLRLPPPPSDGDHFDTYQKYEIEAEDRDALKQHLAEHGVASIVQWAGVPLHQMHSLGFEKDLPETDRLFERLLLLPVNLFVSDDDIDYVVHKVRRFYGQ